MKINSDTFKKGRTCKHCTKQLPDHWHGGIKFCPVFTNENGNTENHQEIHYQSIRAEKLKKRLKFGDVQVKQNDSLLKMAKNLQDKRNWVTEDELQIIDVALSKAYEVDMDAKPPIYFFIDIALRLIEKSKYKFYYHGKQF